jgi:hypothetical protein
VWLAEKSRSCRSILSSWTATRATPEIVNMEQSTRVHVA